MLPPPAVPLRALRPIRANPATAPRRREPRCRPLQGPASGGLRPLDAPSSAAAAGQSGGAVKRPPGVSLRPGLLAARCRAGRRAGGGAWGGRRRGQSEEAGSGGRGQGVAEESTGGLRRRGAGWPRAWHGGARGREPSGTEEEEGRAEPSRWEAGAAAGGGKLSGGGEAPSPAAVGAVGGRWAVPGGGGQRSDSGGRAAAAGGFVQSRAGGGERGGTRPFARLRDRRRESGARPGSRAVRGDAARAEGAGGEPLGLTGAAAGAAPVLLRAGGEQRGVRGAVGTARLWDKVPEKAVGSGWKAARREGSALEPWEKEWAEIKGAFGSRREEVWGSLCCDSEAAVTAVYCYVFIYNRLYLETTFFFLLKQLFRWIVRAKLKIRAIDFTLCCLLCSWLNYDLHAGLKVLSSLFQSSRGRCCLFWRLSIKIPENRFSKNPGCWRRREYTEMRSCKHFFPFHLYCLRNHNPKHFWDACPDTWSLQSFLSKLTVSQ